MGETQRRNESKKGARNPAYRHGGRTGIKGGPRFKSGQDACAKCGAPRSARRLHEHHVVYAQHVTREGGDVTDPLNALALCVPCHALQHNRSAPVPLSALRDENYTFAVALLGAAAYDYLRRRYGGDDARLSSILASGRPGALASRNPAPRRGGSHVPQ